MRAHSGAPKNNISDSETCLYKITTPSLWQWYSLTFPSANKHLVFSEWETIFYNVSGKMWK